MADLEKIAEDLSALTVMEAAELSKLLEEKWGVSAAAPVAVAAAPAAGGDAGGEAYEVGGGEDRAARLGRLERREADEGGVCGAVGDDVGESDGEEERRDDRERRRPEDGDDERTRDGERPAYDEVGLAVLPVDRHRVR